MNRNAYRKIFCLLLCVIVTVMPLSAAAEGMDGAARQAAINRVMPDWRFPLAEEYYDDIVEFAGARNDGSALYDGVADPEPGKLSDGMDIRVPAMAEVYASADGWLYRSTMSDMERGYVAVIEQTVTPEHSYYIILGNISPTAPVASGSYVWAGDLVAYTESGNFHFSAVMDVAGKGQQIAEYAFLELPAISANGWLTESYGTGMICVNPSPYTLSTYGNPMVNTFPGPVSYSFVQPAPVVIPTEAPTAHEHNWDMRVVTIEPTHFNNGEQQVICSGCGESYTETIPASADHVYDQQVASDAYLASPASCTSPAYYYYSCICGQAGGNAFPYGETGDHQWGEPVVTIPASHTANGERTITCMACGQSYSETIPASADHVYDQMVPADEYIASYAGCTAPAQYYYTCVCGAVGAETFAYGETGHHSWGTPVVTREPSHTMEGESIITCISCGQSYTESIPVISDHVFDQQVASDAYLAVPASCGTPAQYYYSCICGAAGGETFVSGAAADHIWDGGVITVQPSHTSDGQVTYTCTVCGSTRTEVMSATADHVYDQAVAEPVYLCSSATCDSPAYYYYSCVCGQMGAETFAYGSASGHSFSDVWSANDSFHWHDATCGHTGETSGMEEHRWDGGVITVQPSHTSDGQVTYTCTVCGSTRTEVMSATADHVYDQAVVAPVYLCSSATCDSPAYYYYSCVCGQMGTQTFADGAASGHSFSDAWSTNDSFHWHDATCGHTGETSGMEEHRWDAGVITVQPSHTSGGTAEYTCTVCGAKRTEALDATPEHTFNQRVVAESYLQSGATCESSAVYYYSCICGQAGTETFADGNSLGHSYADGWSANDTHHWHAATCGHDDKTSGFAEHVWDEGKVITAAGHNKDGEKQFTCTVCGQTRTETIPGEPHMYDQMSVEQKFLKDAATCTGAAVYYKSCICGEKGTETFSYGSALGHSFSDAWSSDENQHWHAATCAHSNERIRVAEHVWDLGRITTQPTETTKGVKTFTCAVCGRTRTEEIAVTAHRHTYSTDWTSNETFHWHAATCGHNSEVGDLGQHMWDGGIITINPTHTTDGQKTYTCLTCSAVKREVLKAEHVFDRQVISAEYLKANASCTAPASYYYSCACGAKGSESFFYGASLGHTMTGIWNRDDSCHWTSCAVCGTRAQLSAHTFANGSNTCAVCGYTRAGVSSGTVVNPGQTGQNGQTSGHTHISHLTRVPGRVATCTTPGNRDYYTCSCGMWFTDVTANDAITDHDSVVIPATGHMDLNKDGKCDVCKAAVPVETITYQMTEGANTTWLSSSEQGLVFRSSSDYKNFDHVEVDGKTISSLNYDVSSGSTIVELSAKYLKTLDIGKHSISIVAKDGKATADFTVKRGTAIQSPSNVTEQKTGGSSVWVVILVLMVLLLLAAAAAVAYLVYFRKPKKGGKFAR